MVSEKVEKALQRAAAVASKTRWRWVDWTGGNVRTKTYIKYFLNIYYIIYVVVTKKALFKKDMTCFDSLKGV